MSKTARTSGGMVVSPHALASHAGLNLLTRGANAVEAVVATAAALCICYPHMTGLGGDGFWLILPSGEKHPVFIDACGRSAANASHTWYTDRALKAVPKRGALAALTMAGAVSGWQAALDMASLWHKKDGGHPSSLPVLFEAAVELGEKGFPVTLSQHLMTKGYFSELKEQPGFAKQFLDNEKVPESGARFFMPVLANTFKRLAAEGLDSFYRGELAKDMARELKEAGSPLSLSDFHSHTAEIREPLGLRLEKATLFNSAAPTQGMASLMILGIFEKLLKKHPDILRDETLFVHSLVESTKQAFMVRDAHLADPEHMPVHCKEFLQPTFIEKLAKAVDMKTALPWPQPPRWGDTVWMGAIDRHGNAVSYIQSVYHEFGSGLVLPETGITWQNRGLGFAFDQGLPNSLAPSKKPFHTLNPAMALTDDGRVMPYGTMGGEGQPQTQAAVFARYYYQNKSLHQAIDEPRWLLGRAWGDQSTSLKLEKSFDRALRERLAAMGHKAELTPAHSSLMGHAGALVRHPDGTIEGASDPRSDGLAAAL